MKLNISETILKMIYSLNWYRNKKKKGAHTRNNKKRNRLEIDIVRFKDDTSNSYQ